MAKKKYYKEKDENVGSEIYCQRISELRFKEQLTLDELSEKTHIPKPTISAWIKGKYTPNIKGLLEIAKALGVTVDYLIGNTDVKQPNIELQAISKYTGLVESSLDFLSKLNSYKIGSPISLPVNSEKDLIGQVTCEYDRPIYIINLLLNKPHILGLFYSYMCLFNEENPSYFQGDKGSAVLFELMLELRKLRDEFQPYYKEAFYKYYEKDGENNG